MLMEPSIFPPGPKGHILFGSLRELRKQPLEFLDHCAAEYGDIVHVKVARYHVYILNDPDLVEEVLVSRNRNFIKPRLLRDTREVFGNGLLVSEGDTWLRQRRLMQPAFHKQRIDAYGKTMTDYTVKMMAEWRDGEERDLHDDMMHLTLSIVAQALFGAEIKAKEMQEVGEMLEIALARFVDRIGFMRLLEKLPLPRNIRFKRAMRQLDNIIYRIIKTKQASGGSEGEIPNVLAMLLAAQDEDGEGMSERQIRDEVITLFLAGHETTAISLSWTFLLLAQNPDVASKLRNELVTILGNRVPTMEDLPKLLYTEKVVKESMRLYPPAWRVGREAVRDCEIAGYRVPAGSQVILPQWTLHRDARYFPEPLRFNPDRWSPAMEEELPKFAYFPFGGGARRCIGDSFAMMEAVLILATIARSYSWKVLPDHPIALWPSITLRPRYGIRALIQKS